MWNKERQPGKVSGREDERGEIGPRKKEVMRTPPNVLCIIIRAAVHTSGMVA